MAQESWNREEESAGCQRPEGPILCANNCGFFGSVTTMNLCSKCYREHSKSPSSAAVSPPIKGLQENPKFELNLTDVINPVVTAAVVLPPAAAEEEEEAPKAVAKKDSAAVEIVLPSSAIAISSSSSSSSSVGIAEEESIQKKGPNRCFACRKRVGLTGFKCRCGDLFCSMHRYSDKHNCSFDYKAAGREAIAKANPVVKAEKIGKI